MAKEPALPVVLPVVRIEKGPRDDGDAEQRENVVDLNAWRYRRQRQREENGEGGE